jgi:choline transport protein
MEDLPEKHLEAHLANDERQSGEVSDLVNASGHKQELDRNFGLWSICALGVCADNAWAAGGGSLVSPRYSVPGERIWRT